MVFAFQVPTSSKAQYYGANSNSESADTILKLDVITKHSKPLHAVASSTKKTRSLCALDQSTRMSRVYLVYISTMIMNMHVQPSHCIPPHSVGCAGRPDPRYMGNSGGYVDRRTHACHGKSSQATCEMYMATVHMHMA